MSPERQEAAQIVKSALAYISTEFPYYDPMLKVLGHVWDAPGVNSFTLDDKGRLFLNSQFIAKMVADAGSVDEATLECTAYLMHQVNHLYRNHSSRVGDRDPGLWNVACDLEINSDLHSVGHPLPGGAILPEHYDPPLPTGLIAEEYYVHLEKQPRDNDE